MLRKTTGPLTLYKFLTALKMACDQEKSKNQKNPQVAFSKTGFKQDYSPGVELKEKNYISNCLRMCLNTVIS